MRNLLVAIQNAFLQTDEGCDLEKVVDWSEKHQRQQQGKHPPFDAGELVKVKGFIEYDDEIGLRIHADADGGIADNFYLVNPVNPEKARVYSGLPLESIVRVMEFREESLSISNSQDYTAGLLDVSALPLLNPTQEQINTTQNNQVIIYGEFVEFTENGEDRFLKSLGFPQGTRVIGEHSKNLNGNRKTRLAIELSDGKHTTVEVENPPSYYRDNETQGIIKTENGREITIDMPTGKIVYTGGNLDNIDGKVPEKGDILRISARISDGQFLAYWCDPCFLINPSEVRFSRSENLRLTLDTDLEQAVSYIQSGKYLEARATLAEVRASEVNESQLDRTYELLERIPTHERPIMTSKELFTGSKTKNYKVKTIDRDYNVRLESMTREEFVNFASKALSGEISPTRKNAETSYIFDLLPQIGFEPLQIEELATHTIQARIEKMKGKSKPGSCDEYLLRSAVNTVYDNETPNAAMIVIETIKKLKLAGIGLPFDVKSCYERLLEDKKVPIIENGNF